MRELDGGATNYDCIGPNSNLFLFSREKVLRRSHLIGIPKILTGYPCYRKSWLMTVHPGGDAAAGLFFEKMTRTRQKHRRAVIPN